MDKFFHPSLFPKLGSVTATGSRQQAAGVTACV